MIKKIIKFPEKKNIEYIKKYFLGYGLTNLFLKDKITYKPDLIDLYRIHQIIILNKRITALEFGCGWSSIVIKHALNINKKKYEIKIRNLRIAKPFQLFSIDNQKKYIKIAKKRNKNILKKENKINFIFSECLMTDFNGRLASEYKTIPLVNPDFIYLDAPNPESVNWPANKFSAKKKYLMPMSCDILKIEHFLTPGTIILIDGRTANARFLETNFQRNWIYHHDKIHDQSIFYLKEEPLGQINRNLINFYSSSF